jgi:hypothetical protein
MKSNTKIVPISSPAPTRRTAKPPSTAVVIQLTPKGVRPDVAAQYLGVTPFRIEEWMRDGLLEFVVPPGSDSRVVPIEVLDKFFSSLPRQKGVLAGRGRNVT